MKKKERYLTILLVPHHKQSQMNFHISYAALRWLLAAVILLLLFVLFLVINYGRIFWRAGQYELILRRHQQMEAEFAKLQNLKAELARLQQQQSKIRLMLGVADQPQTLSVYQVASSPNSSRMVVPELPAFSTSRGSARRSPPLPATVTWVEFSSEIVAPKARKQAAVLQVSSPTSNP